MKILTFIIILFSSISAFPLNNEVDSLTVLLNTTKDKYEIAKINLKLAKLHEQIDLKKGKEFAYKALLYGANDSLSAEVNNQMGRFMFFTAQLDSAVYYFENAKNILVDLNDRKRVAIINISLGAVQLRLGQYNNTIKTLTESAAYFEENGDKLNAAKCYSNISSALAELENYPNAIEYNERALRIFEELNLAQFQLITLPNLAAQYFKQGDTLKAVKLNLEAEKMATEVGNKRSLSIIYNNLGSIYLDSDAKKAKEYLEKTIALKNELNLLSGIEVTQGNLGYLHLKGKDYNNAIFYYNQVAQQVQGKQLVFAYNQLQDCYKGLKLFDKALEYAEKSKTLNDSILSTENQKVFNEIQTKYETEKKQKEILKLTTEKLEVDNKRILNQNLLFGALAILSITFFLVFILLKSSKRKRILVQQELKIKKQEFEQRLKTEELNGIDAIIDAQESERSRIADDLHDNLGSKIATLKFYIEDISNQKNANKEEKIQLHNKIKLLAEDTYKEVRKIAHNKNFGALINKGLIPSIKTIANQISTSDKLQIDVININVNEHIKNNIEIQIFRIIQELLTNILKHAEATEVNIQFSEDEKILNIMVEDNGRGFNINETSFGFGLNNIEKRLEKINGDFVIDSSVGNGTTVILNIPL